MKKRILTGWNLRRVIYTVLGIVVIGESAAQHEWMGIFLGTYFASMGIFAFGCAAGNCFGGTCSTKPANKRIR
jgi:hypothetical protein